MKKLIFIYSFVLLFLANYSSVIYAQKFEGTITYNIHYIPNSKQVKSKDLELQYGNKEIVSIKNGNYRSERQYNDMVLKTTIYDNAKRLSYIMPNQSNYWIKNHVYSYMTKKTVKLDTTATINNYKCDVFRFKKVALKITFFISKEKYAEKDTNSSWFTYPNSFQGPVIKMIFETPDYILVQEAASLDAKSIDNKIFETGDALIVVPMEEITNKIIEPAQRKELLQCFYKNIGYPGFMDLNNIEGKVNVELLIDNTGAVKSTSVRTEYFKKQEESIRIYDTKKINNLEDKIEKKVLPLALQCIEGSKFEAPVSGKDKVNTIYRIPIVFSKYAADIVEDNQDYNEQDIDDSFYDDFDEFY